MTATGRQRYDRHDGYEAGRGQKQPVAKVRFEVA